MSAHDEILLLEAYNTFKLFNLSSPVCHMHTYVHVVRPLQTKTGVRASLLEECRQHTAFLLELLVLGWMQEADDGVCQFAMAL